MDSRINQVRTGSKHHTKPGQHYIHANQPEKSKPQSSSWLDRLTSNAIHPLTLQQQLMFASDSLRSQTFHTLQRQIGNRYIQREALFPASTKGGGALLEEQYLDKTSVNPGAPAPVPYPNTGDITGSSGTSDKVTFADKNLAGKQSPISQSSGDEQGTLKGMASQITQGHVFPTPSAPIVKMAGPPIAISQQPSQTAVQDAGAAGYGLGRLAVNDQGDSTIPDSIDNNYHLMGMLNSRFDDLIDNASFANLLEKNRIC